MTKVADLHKAWSEDPEYRAEYDRLGPEFARLESGRVSPSTRTLEKVARATGARLRIHFDPS